jgi:crotonobetainyl-CoA:carnitine CoA-transferase CaiB-like acyl-CoA transferase
MAGPLAGIRVVEIAQEIQGPYAALLLADLGADVVKVELPGLGDLSRHMRIRLIAGPDAKHPDFSHYFLAMNRGKRSVTLDLKHPDGKRALARLLESADVLVTNYRPGVLDRLGFDHASLAARNPGLVYASGSSWGPEGPWRTRPSRDTLAQAAGGLMAKTGPEGAPPQPCGALVADHSSAFALVAGILAALVARTRTGRGQQVDASIYGTVLALQPMEIAYTSIAGREPERAGRGHQFLHGVWGAFRTRDGWICLAGVDDKRWPAFCAALELEHVKDDPECADVVTRNYHGAKIEAVLDEVFVRRTTAEWMERLAAADVLAAPVASYGEILASEQALANGYLRDLDHPELGTTRVVGNPLTFSETPLTLGAPAPELGQHTEEVLLEAGYDWDAIAGLREAKAI